MDIDELSSNQKKDQSEQIESEDHSNKTAGLIHIVHTTGIFIYQVCWCGCKKAADKATQLFEMHFFLASLLNSKTAFTFDCLNHFYMNALKCKTLASSFISKLHWLTNNLFSHTIAVS